MGVAMLASSLGLSVADAKGLKRSFFDAFPKLGRFGEQLKQRCREVLGAETASLTTFDCLLIVCDDCLLIASLIRCSGRRRWRVGFGRCQTSHRVTRPSARAPSGRL